MDDKAVNRTSSIHSLAAFNLNGKAYTRIRYQRPILNAIWNIFYA